MPVTIEPVIPQDSILRNIKKLLGYEPAYEAFDEDIKIHINTVFSDLQQLGVGPIGGFSIEGYDEIWPDFMGEATDLNEVKTYIYLRVKLIFDTPTTSFVIDSMNKQIDKFEWRLNLKQEGAPTV